MTPDDRMLRDDHERGSTIPLILGFFLIALILVAGSVSLGQAFVQQRDLQDICDGAAAAAVASSADLDRGSDVAAGGSLQLAGVNQEVQRYRSRDTSRRDVQMRAGVSDDARHVTVRCTQTRPLAFGSFFGRSTETHHASSTARAAVVR